MPIPIVEHIRPDPTASWRKQGQRVAEQFSREYAELVAADEFRQLVCRRLDDGPTLHMDDLSEIARLDPDEEARFYQDRARLRAGDGDIVASCADPVDRYAEY